MHFERFIYFDDNIYCFKPLELKHFLINNNWNPFTKKEFKSNINKNINIYFYDQEIELSWLFHALSRCDYKFIDVDNSNDITLRLSGYILGKKNTYYKVDDENTSAVYHFINQNRISNVELFLERALHDKIGH